MTAPLHEAPVARAEAAWSLRRYAAAAALLIASTLGMGTFFGLQQVTLVEALKETAQAYDATRRELEGRRVEALMPRVLEAVLAAQVDHLVRGLDQGRRAVAASFAELAASVREQPFPEQPFPEVGLVRDPWRWNEHYEVVIHRSPTRPERFMALGVPRRPTERPLQTFFIDDEGRMASFASAEAVLSFDPERFDLEACRLGARQHEEEGR